MKQKIEWYQEVLAVEPGSKVFFPLARLLAETGETEKAVQILRHGLDRHPDFLEARLYLTDLLFSAGQTEQCEEMVRHLAPLFSRYAGFWQAWSNSAAASGKAGDAGLMLLFLSAIFRQGSLTLADALARGLNASAPPISPQAEATQTAAAQACTGETSTGQTAAARAGALSASLPQEFPEPAVTTASPAPEPSLAVSMAVPASAFVFPHVDAPCSATPADEPHPEKAGVLSVLEALAKRLETRGSGCLN